MCQSNLADLTYFFRLTYKSELHVVLKHNQFYLDNFIFHDSDSRSNNLYLFVCCERMIQKLHKQWQWLIPINE